MSYSRSFTKISCKYASKLFRKSKWADVRALASYSELIRNLESYSELRSDQIFICFFLSGETEFYFNISIV